MTNNVYDRTDRWRCGRCGEHDPGAPDMLLRAVAVRDDSVEPVTICGGQFDDDSSSHRTSTHPRESQSDSNVEFNPLVCEWLGIAPGASWLLGNQPSDCESARAAERVGTILLISTGAALSPKDDASMAA